MSDHLQSVPPDVSSAPSSPTAVAIPDSHKKRIIDQDNTPTIPFRILDLPDELRLKIYDFVLPSGVRIFLDPENIEFPSQHLQEIEEVTYEDVLTTLLICKKIHVEATEYIYSNNRVNIVKPLDTGNFLGNLGSLACEYITKLECHVDNGIGDLGHIWKTMEKCNKLEDLRLVFYHEKRNWSKTLAQIAWYLWENDNDTLELAVELHTSVHPRQPMNAGSYQTNFERHFQQAMRGNHVYSFSIPQPLRKITITASVTADAAYGFATFISEDDAGAWVQKDSVVDTAGMKTLFWQASEF